jgi:hypothetical protein
MADRSIKNELSRLDRDSLYAIAKRLDIKSYRHTRTKDRLVDLILQNSTPEQIREVELIPAPRNRSMLGRFSSLDSGKQALVSIATIIAAIFTVLSYMRPSTPVVVSNPTGSGNENSPGKNIQNSNSIPTSPQAVRLPVEKPSPKQDPAPQPSRRTAGVPSTRSGNNGFQASSLLNRARQLYNQRKFQEAIDLCDQVLSHEPNNVEAISLRKQITHTITTLNNYNQ